ncbi:hypothetical protein D3C75_1107460 [compost metagenome]
MQIQFEQEIVADLLTHIFLPDTEDQLKSLRVAAPGKHQGIGQILDLGALHK